MSWRRLVSAHALVLVCITHTPTAARADEPVAPEAEAKYAAILSAVKTLPSASEEDVAALDAAVVDAINAFRDAQLDVRVDRKTKAESLASMKQQVLAGRGPAEQMRPGFAIPYYQGLVDLHRWLRIAAALGMSGTALAHDPFVDFSVKLREKNTEFDRQDRSWNGTLYPFISASLTLGIPLAHDPDSPSADDADRNAMLACPLVATGTDESSPQRRDRMAVFRDRMRSDPTGYSSSAMRFVANVVSFSGDSLPAELVVTEPPGGSQAAKPKKWGEAEGPTAIPVRFVPPAKDWSTIAKLDDQWSEYRQLRLETGLKKTLVNCAVLADRLVVQAAADQLRAAEKARAAGEARVLHDHQNRNVLLKSHVFDNPEGTGKPMRTLPAGEVVRVVGGLTVTNVERGEIEAGPLLKIESENGETGWVSTTAKVTWKVGATDHEEDIEALSEDETIEQADLARGIALSATSYYRQVVTMAAAKKRGVLAADQASVAQEQAQEFQEKLCRARAVYQWNYGAPALKALEKDFRVVLKQKGEPSAKIEAIVKATFTTTTCTP